MDSALITVAALHFGVVAYVGVSAYKRKMWWPMWALACVFTGILIVPVFRAVRHLKSDEIRKGGTAYVIMHDYARMVIFGMIVLVFAMCTVPMEPQQSDAEAAGVLMGSWMGAICLLPFGFGIWLLPRLVKNDSVEKGPTGPLAE